MNKKCGFFLHGGALCHTLRATKRFLVDEDIQRLNDWSTESPDLNIIEAFCCELMTHVLQ